MSNLSEATEAIMTNNTDTTDVAVDTDAEENSSADSNTPVVVFEMDANDVPFKRLKSAFDSKDSNGFHTIIGAIEMMYGHGAEVIKAGFHNTMKAEQALLDIQKYDKELAGYTASASLIKLLKAGMAIAKEADGNVAFSISVVKGEGEDSEEKAVIKSAFRGIKGVGSKRGGTGSKGRFQYSVNGTPIETSLKKYLSENHPNSKATGIINEYADKPNSNISAWDAAQRGMKAGDSFVITRGEKKPTTDSSSS